MRRSAFFFIIALLLLATGCERAPRQTEWIRERLVALEDIYNVSREGREWLANLDARQKMGRPTWFASYEGGWIEVGQAIPESIMHEVGHAYWVSFLRSQRPADISGREPSLVLERYRSDLIGFMLQPPDRYEPLRERFRNLPNLSTGEYPDLYHSGEADMVNMVGGNLNLVPPILSPYFDKFLLSGEFKNWQEAISWYRGLSREDVRRANAYFGLTHIGLKRYGYVRPQSGATVSRKVAGAIEKEERQRLLDFARQFGEITVSESSLADAVGAMRSFPFWRGYLREMFQLYKKYPGVLKEKASGEHGPKIAKAFDTLKQAESLAAQEKLDFLKGVLARDPFMEAFIPILENRLLVELLSAGPSESGGTGPSAQEYVGRLREYIAHVDATLAIGRDDPEKGAQALEEYISNLPKERRQDLDTFFEILQDTDSRTTENIVDRLGEEAIRQLLSDVPARVRVLLGPQRLLRALRITTQASPLEITEGISLLLKHTSGNYEIEEPFLNETYRVLALRGHDNPIEALEIIRATSLPISAFILGYPKDAVGILSADPEKALDIIINGDGYRTPPVRLVYNLIYADPVFAASIAKGLSSSGKDEVVEESLVYFAYDYDRIQENPSLSISLKNDGLFIETLAKEGGEDWLKSRLNIVVERYESYVRSGKVDADFMEAYKRTWQAIIGLQEDPEARTLLRNITDAAFGGTGGK
ncbi:MAG: hypothetical protein HYX82_04290 [Chloroflexi bacterium]|nr:hypothetical protein [Chloroflexota bacterium]